jgi:flagellar protein FlgJ
MLGSTSDLSGKFALDTNSLGDLKQSAKAGSPEALEGRGDPVRIHVRQHDDEEHARRDAAGRPMDSQETKTFTTMLDQQMSQKLAKRGIGLADVLVRQLTAQQRARRWPRKCSRARWHRRRPRPQGAGATRLKLDSDSMSTDGAARRRRPDRQRAQHHHSGKPAHVRAFQDKLADAAEEAERSPACRPSS